MTFEQWIALAFPWLLPVGPDYRNLHAAWSAGFDAGKDARNAGYFDTACKRIAQAVAQPDLFIAQPPKPTQEALL